MTTYSTKATAIRGAKRQGIVDPIISRDSNGRWIAEAKADIEARNALPEDKKARRHASTDRKGAVARVHEIVAAAIARNADVKRKDLMALCEAEEIAFFTARTQIQRALSAHRAA